MLQTIAIGYIGKDAYKRDVNGKTVLNFSVAHSEKYKDAKGTTTEKTTWVECNLWDKEALAPYLLQGTLVCVQGTPEARAYMSKEGTAAASLSLRVVKIDLLGGKKEGTAAAPQAAAAPAPAAAQVEDGLPF